MIRCTLRDAKAASNGPEDRILWCAIHRCTSPSFRRLPFNTLYTPASFWQKTFTRALWLRGTLKPTEANRPSDARSGSIPRLAFSNVSVKVKLQAPEYLILLAFQVFSIALVSTCVFECLYCMRLHPTCRVRWDEPLRCVPFFLNTACLGSYIPGSPQPKPAFLPSLVVSCSLSSFVIRLVFPFAQLRSHSRCPPHSFAVNAISSIPQVLFLSHNTRRRYFTSSSSRSRMLSQVRRYRVYGRAAC